MNEQEKIRFRELLKQGKTVSEIAKILEQEKNNPIDLFKNFFK